MAHLLIEQPAAPRHVPECVSFWKTKEWRELKEAHKLQEQTFNQGDYLPGQEVAVKPTTVGGTLELELPQRRNYQAKTREEGDGDSKALARWNAGFNRAIAKACAQQVFDKGYALRQLTWQQHVDCGHTPFRRDCRICQESSAKARPHRSVPNPICGVLSVDVTGPLKASKVDGKRMRYILVGAFTWIKPTTVASPAEAHLPDVEEGEIPLEEDHEEDVHEDAEEDALGGEGSAEPGEVAAGEEGAEVKEEVEIKDGFETVTYRLAIPLESRNSGEVMAAVHEMYVQLRILGYPVTRLHSDKAREFMSQLMVNWCRNRNIMKTSTAAMTSQANGSWLGTGSMGLRMLLRARDRETKDDV